MVDSCEHSNEPANSLKLGEYIERLNDYQILKKKYAPCRKLLHWWQACTTDRVPATCGSFKSQRKP